MLEIATDWVTLSSLATALGTLVLAVATFAAVRSGIRATRVSEIVLREQRRPVLVNSRLDDADQKMMFADRHWIRTAGGRAVAEHRDGVVYLGISLRNVGQGMAVCQGWTVAPSLSSARDQGHAPLDQYRTQTVDIYIPAGDIGMWYGALRDPNDPVRAMLAQAIDFGDAISIELLYTDLVGDQRTVSRFGMLPGTDTWYTSMSRHWHIDGDGPRAERERAQASGEIRRHIDTAAEITSDDAVG